MNISFYRMMFIDRCFLCFLV